MAKLGLRPGSIWFWFMSLPTITSLPTQKLCLMSSGNQFLYSTLQNSNKVVPPYFTKYVYYIDCLTLELVSHNLSLKYHTFSGLCGQKTNEQRETCFPRNKKKKMVISLRFFIYYFLIEVQLIYNIVLVSGVRIPYIFFRFDDQYTHNRVRF